MRPPPKETYLRGGWHYPPYAVWRTEQRFQTETNQVSAKKFLGPAVHDGLTPQRRRGLAAKSSCRDWRAFNRGSGLERLRSLVALATGDTAVLAAAILVPFTDSPRCVAVRPGAVTDLLTQRARDSRFVSRPAVQFVVFVGRRPHFVVLPVELEIHDVRGSTFERPRHHDVPTRGLLCPFEPREEKHGAEREHHGNEERPSSHDASPFTSLKRSIVMSIGRLVYYATEERRGAPLRSSVVMSQVFRPGWPSARNPRRAMVAGSPASPRLPFDHAHALWQDRAATADAPSVLYQRRRTRMSPTIARDDDDSRR